MVASTGGNGPKPPTIPVRVRVAAIAVILLLIGFLAVVDTLGRLFIDRQFAVGQFIFGTLAGVLLGLFGIEGLARIVGR